MPEPEFFPEGSTARRADSRWRQLQKILGAFRAGGGMPPYDPPAAVGNFPNDSFEDYSSGADLEGLNGGENGNNGFDIDWASDWVIEPWLGVTGDGALDPDDISGLQVWSKADQITAANGQVIDQWDDVSGNNRHFEASLAQRPEYQTGVQNGLPAVFFSSTAGVGMGGAYTRAAGDLSVMIVFKPNGTGNGRRRAIQGANDWTIGPYGRIMRVVFNDNQFYNAYQDSTTDCHVMILTQTATGPVTKVYLDGAEGGMGTVAQAWPGLISLGATGGFNDPLNGWIMELAVYDKVLSESEAYGLSLAMINKWGI